MIAVFTVLFVLAASLAVIRFAAVALTLTGMSREMAQFQALSAFTTSGFTTREAEEIVSHPVRRRIVMHLMLTGNAGVIIVIPSVILSFLTTGASTMWWSSVWFRAGMLGFGVFALLLLASSKHIERLLWRVDTWALRHFTDIEVQDYTGLLRLTGDYSVCKLPVHADDWLAGRTLADSALTTEGVLVLGIERDGQQYLGAPKGTSRIEPDDVLVLYGRQQTLEDLAARRAGIEGNMQHVIAVTRQIDVEAEELDKLDHMSD